ncbi:unnamed protein product [Calypogeia fissa]
MAALLSSPFTFFTSCFQRSATVVLWVLLLTTVNGQNGTSEIQTLLQFRNVMQVDTSAISLGYWSTWQETDPNPCKWWGVTCTANLTVEQLDLSNWGMTVLPAFSLLSNLSDLRSLDLGYNNFRDPIKGLGGGSIPDDVGSLTGLTRLVLQDSLFGGSIPGSLSACRKLQYLSLANNVITGEIPDLSSLVDLQYLYLGDNELFGPLPAWLGQLNTLLDVDLSNNFLNGTIPSLANLTNVRQFTLHNNSFTGFEEPIFPGATNLEQLSVSLNYLTGQIPTGITQLPSLKSLDLSSNQLSGSIPSSFSINMSEGGRLDLSQNQLEGGIPANLLQSTSAVAVTLPVLNLSNNLLTGPIPFNGTKQYNYNTLDFSNNSLNGSIPSICRTGNIINNLMLGDNNLAGDILDFFVECYDHISNMVLANNSFSGDLSSIAYANASVDFALREARLQGGVRDLSNNNLQMRSTEANPDPLMAFLEFFVLNTSLGEVYMQGNDFTGTPLPRNFSLPASSLQVLDLSNNHLAGQISGSAFNSTWLPALQQLNLSNNDITGPIPEALVTLPNLTVLNVINNDLFGPLPPMPTKFNPNIFAGNGLCGPPLRPCSQPRGVQFHWWILLIIIGGSVIIAVGSCVAVTWRWTVYRKIHKQDADLIKTLLERESASLMSLRELKRATNNFSESAQIGEGGFGIVYVGKLSDGTSVAIKRSKYERSENHKNRFLNEVRILSQINHRHLVKLLGCCMESGIALLVFEFVSNGTLLQHLQGKLGPKRLSWDERLNIAVQTANAINYLHSAASFPIYHRDVKSANILLDGDLNAKVADFGISRLVPLEATHVSTIAIQGTIGYIDPEYYTSYQLNGKSDVYSFGVVLLELISAKPPIDFHRGGENTGLVSFAKPYIESGDLQSFIDVALLETYNDAAGHGRKSILRVGRLAMKCLQMRSQDRPSMHNVWKELQNMWFALHGTIESLSPIDDDENVRHEDIILLSGTFSGDSANFSLNKDDTGIQMATRH